MNAILAGGTELPMTETSLVVLGLSVLIVIVWIAYLYR